MTGASQLNNVSRTRSVVGADLGYQEPGVYGLATARQYADLAAAGMIRFFHDKLLNPQITHTCRR